MDNADRPAGPRFARGTLLSIAVLAAILAGVFGGPLIRGHVFVFRDHTDYFEPLRSFTVERLQRGSLPLWNPFNASGEAWLANPQTAVFYPPSALFYVLPFPAAYVLFLALHLLILGCGSFLLFVRRASAPAALAGAVTMMLCGPVLSLLDVQNNLMTFAWLPLLLVVALAKPSLRTTLLTALLLTLSFLAGEPFLALVTAAIYSCVMIGTHGLRVIRNVAGAGLLAAGMGAVQLLPFLQMLAGSDRLGAQRPEEIFRESMHPLDWLLVLLPVRALDSAMNMSQHFIPSLYIGLPVVLLAMLGVIRGLRDSTRRRITGAWLALFAGTVALAAGRFFPLMALLTQTLRLAISRYPARIVPVGVLAIVALAVEGLRDVDLPAGVSSRGVWSALTLTAALTLAAIQHAGGLPPSTSLVLALAGVAVVIAGLLTHGIARTLMPGAVILLLIADLLVTSYPLLASGPWNRTVPFAPAIGRSAKLIRLPPEELRGSSSMMTLDRRDWIAGYRNLYEERFDASSAAPVGNLLYSKLHDGALFGARMDVLAEMSAGYLMTTRTLSRPGLMLAAQRGRVNVYALRTMPFASFWSSVRAYNTDEEAVRATLEQHDPYSLIVSGAGASSVIAQQPPVRARVRRMEGSTVAISVDAPQAGVLVLTQQDAPAWRVRVDGKDAPKLHAMGVFRAVALRAGVHEVEWKYDDMMLGAGMWISAISAAALLILLAKSKRAATHF